MRDISGSDLGHALIVKKDDRIWLLKCKPSCWRLYFYVFYKQMLRKQIIYVYAVCKKKNREDPRAAAQAERIADEIRPGGSGITLFDFPVG